MLVTTGETGDPIGCAWKRCVDNTYAYCILEKRHASAILKHLNSLCASIQFTMEMEENGRLPFLDTLIQRNGTGMIDTSVYRKCTHTDHYLQYFSYHPNHVKRGMVSGLYHQARAINQGDCRAAEEQNLTRVLMENGYPHEVVRTASDIAEWERNRHTTPSTSPMCTWPWRGSQADLQEV